jgi:hypothetical protein
MEKEEVSALDDWFGGVLGNQQKRRKGDVIPFGQEG